MSPKAHHFIGLALVRSAGGFGSRSARGNWHKSTSHLGNSSIFLPYNSPALTPRRAFPSQPFSFWPQLEVELRHVKKKKAPPLSLRARNRLVRCCLRAATWPKSRRPPGPWCTWPSSTSREGRSTTPPWRRYVRTCTYRVLLSRARVVCHLPVESASLLGSPRSLNLDPVLRRAGAVHRGFEEARGIADILCGGCVVTLPRTPRRNFPRRLPFHCYPCFPVPCWTNVPARTIQPRTERISRRRKQGLFSLGALTVTFQLLLPLFSLFLAPGVLLVGAGHVH